MLHHKYSGRTCVIEIEREVDYVDALLLSTKAAKLTHLLSINQSQRF